MNQRYEIRFCEFLSFSPSIAYRLQLAKPRVIANAGASVKRVTACRRLIGPKV